jgi:chitodextrinase
MEFSIRIVDADGNPRSGVRVHNWNWTTFDEYTDEDGWAEIDAGDGTSPCSGSLSADGEDLGKVVFEDGETYSFTV